MGFMTLEEKESHVKINSYCNILDPKDLDTSVYEIIHRI